MRESFLMTFSQPCRYAALLSIVLFSMPVKPQGTLLPSRRQVSGYPPWVGAENSPT